MTARLDVDSAAGLEVVRVGNDTLELAFLPQRGGRLISLRVAGRELLWRNPEYLSADLTPVVPPARWPVGDASMGGWLNMGGGKTWPAPQGWGSPDEWSGPPDEVLDAGAYDLTSRHEDGGAVALSLTSGPDLRSGLQITRSFTVPPSGGEFSERICFHNHSGRPRRWSMWEVVQVDTDPAYGAGGHVLVDLDSGGRTHLMLAASGAPQWSVAGDGSQVIVPAQQVVGKLGFPGARGSITWQRGDGARLSLQAQVDRAGAYPDGGCPVELWLQYPLAAPLPELGGLHPKAHLVELELLSPMHDIGPGETVSMDIDWSCQVGDLQRPAEGGGDDATDQHPAG